MAIVRLGRPLEGFLHKNLDKKNSINNLKDNQVKKKTFYKEINKKSIGVDDLTLLSKIGDETINENLRKRFENKEIYVCWCIEKIKFN